MPRKTRGCLGHPVFRCRASMRPRPDAAENHHVAAVTAANLPASMRPRPDAAENSRGQGPASASATRFNEAAARCRGKPAAAGLDRDSIRQRFNEAAARCRGKRPFQPPTRLRARRFNEAAARCRGKPILPGDPIADDDGASMRPRPDAAENDVRAARGKRIGNASMRPRPDAAENPTWAPVPTATRKLQ